MGTFIGIVIAFVIGVLTGLYASRKMQESIEAEQEIERKWLSDEPAGKSFLDEDKSPEDKKVDEIDAFLEADAEEQRITSTYIPVQDHSVETRIAVDTPKAPAPAVEKPKEKPAAKTYIIQPRDTWAGVARKIGAKQIDIVKLDKDPRFGFKITRQANGDIQYESRFPRLKNQDGAALVSLIADQGEEAWISKTTANKALGWGFPRFKRALEYLQRNRYIKAIDEKKNRGAKYAVKAK